MLNVNNNSNSKIILVAGFIAIAALTRLLPHLPNFTPIAAMALFGGAKLQSRKLAFGLTFLAMLVSDVLVNRFLYNQLDVLAYFKEPFVWAVYLSFGLTVFLGIKLSSNATVKRIAGFSITSSLLFWILTNFACWPGNMLYSQDITGLLQCYVAAIPFLGNIAGDLFYSALLFGVYYLAEKRIAIPAKA